MSAKLKIDTTRVPGLPVTDCAAGSNNLVPRGTARSREDETRNARRNANRIHECWGDFSQLVKIEKIKFLGISWYKLELKFSLNLNSSVSCGTNSNPDFGLI